MADPLRALFIRLAQRAKGDPQYMPDPTLTGGMLLRLLLDRGWAYWRGLWWRPRLRSAGSPFFVGRGVRIAHSRLLSVGNGVTLEDHVYIDALSREGVRLGDHVSVGKFTIIEATGIITNLGVGFEIGADSNLGDYNYVGAAGGVRIGRNVLIGQRVSFHSENHVFDRTDIPIKAQGVTRQGIVVEDDCWLGAGVIVLDGVTIGRGSVVAAGSVVTKSVPPFSVVGGVPARILRMREGASEEGAD